MTEEHGAPSWSSGRLGGGDIPASDAPQRPRRSARSVAGTAARWTGTGLMALAGLGLLGAAGTIVAEHEAELASIAAPAKDARQHAKDLRTAEASLPDEATAKRALSVAQESATRAAELQNSYLTARAPLSLDGIPTQELQPDGKTKVFTEEERIKMAEDRRADETAGVSRSLASLFDPLSTDADGLDASSDWALGSEALSGADGLWDAHWTASSALQILADGTTPFVWELVSSDGSVLAWATADYDHKTTRFSDLVVSTAEKGV